MIDPMQAVKRKGVAQVVLAFAMLAATHCTAHANAECFDRLLASLTAPADVSVCKLLSLTDGHVVAVRTEHGLFVQSASGPTSTHYFIASNRRQIEAVHFPRRHTYPPMDRAQPDAKQYYYPFYGVQRGGGMARAPKLIAFNCQRPAAFHAASVEPCAGWSAR